MLEQKFYFWVENFRWDDHTQRETQKKNSEESKTAFLIVVESCVLCVQLEAIWEEIWFYRQSLTTQSILMIQINRFEQSQNFVLHNPWSLKWSIMIAYWNLVAFLSTCDWFIIKSLTDISQIFLIESLCKLSIQEISREKHPRDSRTATFTTHDKFSSVVIKKLSQLVEDKWIINPSGS